MMRLNNGSSSSVGSKDKELPPVPPQDSILKVKTLNRKNLKNLQLSDDRDLKFLPTYGLSPSQTTPLGGSSFSNSIQSTNIHTTNVHATNLPSTNLHTTNLHTSSTQSHSLSHYPTGKIVNTVIFDDAISNRSSISSTSLLNISQRHIDPDLVSSTDNIINQISTLELNPQHKSKFIRKKQTVISSISPTKSTSLINSPKEDPQLSPVYSTTSLFKFNSKDLVTFKDLGSGNSGIVSKILHVPTQRIMAKKIIPIELKVLIQNQIIRELKILHECQSPYIIEFFGAFIKNNNTVVICMEYCNCRSLDKVLDVLDPKQFPLVVLKRLTYSILKGLVYLYENHKIIHRDIKPLNVLMTHKGQFKLCDFGVSRELTNSLAMADTFVGTSTYMSPERIQGLEYGIKSDIWSMGLMLVELASGKSIWHDDKKSDSNDINLAPGPEGILDLLQRIVNEDPPTLQGRINPVTKEEYDAGLCQFINYCLIKDDKTRKSPWELLALTDCNFLHDVKNLAYDKQMKAWAKKIRTLQKDKSDKK